MPNYIKNRIEIIGTPEQIEEVFQKYNTHVPAKIYTAHDGTFICREVKSESFSVGWLNPNTGNFSRRNEEDVLGLPEGWEIEIQQARDVFPDFNKIKPQPENIFNGNLGKAEEEMCKSEGRPTWYDWNIQHWGTKWNISECEKEKYNTFTFITAWNGVPGLILLLSEQNPDVQINYEYADEDTGSNCASYKFHDGVIINEFLPESGTKEAYDLSFKLRPDERDNYVLVDGSYEYQDED